ncbi:hypothetical protein, partial [uncultured Desulfovibrio sp.]|uniref:hypothetical protein n=1 Tax=uncultured Desulfovibrio sp. TaxID=167968 RepID=UPI0026706F5E
SIKKRGMPLGIPRFFHMLHIIELICPQGGRCRAGRALHTLAGWRRAIYSVIFYPANNQLYN